MWTFKQAKNFYPGRNRNERLLIVIHDAEVADSPTTAEALLDLFASVRSPKASFHFAVDRNSVGQGVKIGDTAWAAPGANADGIQIELFGFARFTREKWLEPNEDKVLNWGALVVAELLVTFRRLGGDISLKHLTVAEIKNPKQSGLVGHRDVNAAFHKSTHTDPGVEFPWDLFLPKVKWWMIQIELNPKWKPSFV